MLCRKKKTTLLCEAVQWKPFLWTGRDIGRMLGSGVVVQTGPEVGRVLVLGERPKPVCPGEWIVWTEPTELESRRTFVEILPDEDFRAMYKVA